MLSCLLCMAPSVRPSPLDKPVTITKQQCGTKFAIRRYIPLALQRLPPILYTFPGSGNTWCRLLIEYATSFYTGAVYDDTSLLADLHGELKCNREISVVKAHPFTHPFADLHRGNFTSDNDKCKKGKVHFYTMHHCYHIILYTYIRCAVSRNNSTLRSIQCG
jgi:hypothetical protein